jgi:hypothetical protein
MPTHRSLQRNCVCSPVPEDQISNRLAFRPPNQHLPRAARHGRHRQHRRRPFAPWVSAAVAVWPDRDEHLIAAVRRGVTRACDRPGASPFDLAASGTRQARGGLDRVQPWRWSSSHRGRPALQRGRLGRRRRRAVERVEPDRSARDDRRRRPTVCLRAGGAGGWTSTAARISTLACSSLPTSPPPTARARAARESACSAPRCRTHGGPRAQAHHLSHPAGTIAGMAASHFSPHQAAPQPCWHCRHFGGMLYAGTAAACMSRDSARVRAMPANGCSGFEREVGADDEPEPPARSAACVRTGSAPGVSAGVRQYPQPGAVLRPRSRQA